MSKAQKTPPVDPASASASYICIEPIQHNGKRHEPDDEIALTEDEAASLLAMGAIKQPE